MLLLTPWLMELGGSMPHSQGLSNNPYPEPNQPNSPYWYLHSSILATCPANLNLLDLITLTILGERYKLWSSSLWSPLHSPFSSLLGPNICLSFLFSNTLSLCSSKEKKKTLVPKLFQHVFECHPTVERKCFYMTTTWTPTKTIPALYSVGPK